MSRRRKDGMCSGSSGPHDLSVEGARRRGQCRECLNAGARRRDATESGRAKKRAKAARYLATESGLAFRARSNARRRARWQSDPEYRAVQIARTTRWNSEHREHRAAYQFAFDQSPAGVIAKALSKANRRLAQHGIA